MNAGVFHFDDSQADNTIALSYPLPLKVQITNHQVTLESESKGVATVSLSAHGHTPHYVPMDDELVSTLACYGKQTGLKGHEQVIGGGTFGRLLKRGVAFGAMFPDMYYHAPS